MKLSKNSDKCQKMSLINIINKGKKRSKIIITFKKLLYALGNVMKLFSFSIQSENKLNIIFKRKDCGK